MIDDLNAAALGDGQRSISHLQLRQQVSAFADALRQRGARVLATLLDNSPAWVVADLAAEQAQVVHVPLPVFFTPAQIGHALRSAGVDTVLVASAALAAWPAITPSACRLAGQDLHLLTLPAQPVPMPPGTAKITFTSGTTGTPKGVCLSRQAMHQVAAGIGQALQPLGIERHLCVLPLAVLLENIAGVMAPLTHGAQCVIPPLADVGLTGSSGFDPACFHAAVERHQPHSLIVLPQMLAAWAAWLAHTGRRAPACLRMVAVGGAAVGARLIASARAVGIPAYEGYGLSEGASVQTMNLPGADRPGSAGKPLPHTRVRVSGTGEIEVAGSLFAGYLGDTAAPPAWWPTGDLGRIDADGYLHIHGRSRNVLITAFARNVSPEWVESALRDEPGVAQAVVLGDAQPALSAVLWPAHPGLPDTALQAAVDAANATLPDYARVRRWVRCAVPFCAATGLATANGRPQRDAVQAMHARALGFHDINPIEQTENGKKAMSFHERLLRDTQQARAGLLGAPIIQGCLRGEVSLPSYLAFLEQAWHHVRHTVPLLKACKAALPAQHAWLDEPLDEYVEEEQGHDEWILDDIRACGGDVDAVRRSRPGPAAEVMLAYAYDTIARGNPLGFFGMVHVLEGTSVSLALLAADSIQKPLGLPDTAFSYLRSHGTLDREHTAHFALLMDAITDARDQDDIVHGARMFYRLYGDVFRGLPMPVIQPAAVAA